MRRLASLLAGAAFLGAVPASAQGGRDWSPDERAVIGDYGRVSAVAATFDRVYVASTTGVVLWRPLERRWDGPYDPPDATVLGGVFLAVADPLDQSLWLARPDGVVHFQPELRLWQVVPLFDRLRGLALDRDDPGSGVYVLGSAGWSRIPPGGLSAVPAAPPRRPLAAATVDDAIRANRTLEANAAQILLDERGRVVRYTSAAPAADGIGWYVGTSGVGLLYLRPGDALPQRLRFGTAGTRIAALFAAPGGVWAASERTAFDDAALSYVAADLGEFRVLRGPPTQGLGGLEVRRLAGQQRDLWLASDAGLTRIEVESGRVERFDMGRGLPDNRATWVLPRRGSVYVATPHGIARVTDSLTVERLGRGYTDPVLALEVGGDSVWLGTPSGLLLVPPGAEAAGRTPGLAASAAFQAPVLSLAWLADTLVALTPDQLLWRAPGGDAWTLGPNLSATLGRLRTFVASGPGFFVAGDRGLGFAGLRTPVQRPWLGADLPGPVRDLAVEGDYLWVATERGLVRWRRDVVGP